MKILHSKIETDSKDLISKFNWSTQSIQPTQQRSVDPNTSGSNSKRTVTFKNNKLRAVNVQQKPLKDNKINVQDENADCMKRGPR